MSLASFINSRLVMRLGMHRISASIDVDNHASIALCERLGLAGYKVKAVAAKAYEQARRPSHTIFVGDRVG